MLNTKIQIPTILHEHEKSKIQIKHLNNLKLKIELCPALKSIKRKKK